MLALTVTLFGGFEIRGAAGARYDLPGQKERALLAVFALSPTADHSRDWLAGLLWSERENSQARDSLKHAIARLRHCFEPAGIAVIRADRNSAGVNAAAMQIDVVEFENTLKETSIESDARALGLYRGEFLEGISIRDPAFEDWLRIERQRLRNLAEAAATRLMQGALLAGSGERADFAAQRLLSLDPLREDACRALMQLHHAQGETAQALKLFETLRDRLRRELGVTPEPETIRLSGAIRHMRGSAASAPATPLTLPERPSIAVMPFRNVSGDPEQDYFADGIAEDIITALSHYRWFQVIARNSSFVFRDRAPGLREIARELGVRYILEGSVRKIGTRVRLTAELIEPETGIHVWGERYDRDLADIFAIQDDLTRQVVGAIEPEVLRGESQRALAKTSISLDAYDCHMRGVWHHNLQGGPEDFNEAIRWQRRAIGLDPNLARAYMILSRSLYARCLYGYSDDLERDRRDLLEAATRAVALEDRDAYAHYAMCCAHLLDLQPAAAVIDAERATELAPNLALAQNALGWARIFAGRFAEAIEPIETAMRLSPRDPITYFFNSRLGLAHFHLGNHEAAVRYSQRALSARPRYFIMLVLLAGLVRLGRTEEARALVAQARANRPPDAERYCRHIFPYADPAHRAELFEGLRKAGLEHGDV